MEILDGTVENEKKDFVGRIKFLLFDLNEPAFS